MESRLELISDILQSYVHRTRRYQDLIAGWKDFLWYLKDRCGADLDGARGSLDVETGLSYLNRQNPDIQFVEDRQRWLDRFELREDVRNAFTLFLQYEGLPLTAHSV